MLSSKSLIQTKTYTYICRPRGMGMIQRRPVSLFDIPTLNFEAHLIGKSIIVFTMIYCGLNWNLYRSARIRDEKERKDKK
jgi:hypothetical protein